MSFSPYFPTGFLEGVFHGILGISSYIFPTGFLKEIISRMISHKDKRGLGGVLGFN